MKLAETLGSFAGQLTENPITGVKIEYEGNVAQLNTKPMTAAALNGVLKPQMGDINMVSAPQIAKDRGINVEVATRDQQGAYEGYIRLTVIDREAGAEPWLERCSATASRASSRSRASTWRRS